MALKNTQDKPGTQFTKSRNPNKPTPKRPDGMGGQAKPGTPHASSGNTPDRGGQAIEGQNLRGYVFNESGRSIGAVSDATVAPDGTKRVVTIHEGED